MTLAERIAQLRALQSALYESGDTWVDAHGIREYKLTYLAATQGLSIETRIHTAVTLGLPGTASTRKGWTIVKILHPEDL